MLPYLSAMVNGRVVVVLLVVVVVVTLVALSELLGMVAEPVFEPLLQPASQAPRASVSAAMAILPMMPRLSSSCVKVPEDAITPLYQPRRGKINILSNCLGCATAFGKPQFQHGKRESAP